MLSDPDIWEPSSGDGAHTGNETPKFDHATALPESRALMAESNLSITTEPETRDQVCFSIDLLLVAF